MNWLAQVSRASAARRASGLIVVIIFVTIMGFTISSLTNFGIHQRRQAERMRIYQEELTAAETAIDAMIGQVRFFANYKPFQVGREIQNFHNAVLNLSPPEVPGFDFIDASVTCEDGGDLTYETITDPSDPWYGYTLLRVDYRLRVQTKSASEASQRLGHPGVALERLIRVEQKPLYAYAIFYGNDLELDAGQRIDIIGRVHSNNNFYLTTSSEAYYHRSITVAGDFFGGIYHPATGRGTSNSDNVYVTTDGDDSFAQVKGTASDSNIWLDSRVDTWIPESIQRWNGHLRDSAHGINPIGLPIPSTEDPHVLIEPSDASDPPSVADAKFANKADIAIYGDPQDADSLYAVDQDGNSVPLTYVPEGEDEDEDEEEESIVQTSTIYNGREEKYVDIIDVDMSKLIESGLNVGDGVIYVSPDQPSAEERTSRQAAVRLLNAETVPTNTSGALTVATDAPLYTKGDVNTSGDNILMLACDAINILSDDFDDGDYQDASDGGDPEQACATTTNAVFLSGNVPSADGRYSGGAENFFRYIERWGSGAPHTFNGSLLNLYQSQIATAPWDQDPTYGSQSSDYYSPPRRIWSWDPALAGIVPPPGMPTFLEIHLNEWELAAPVAAG